VPSKIIKDKMIFYIYKKKDRKLLYLP